MKHLLDGATAVGVTPEGAIGERLEHFEALTALLAAVFVGGHNAIYQGFEGRVSF